MEVAKEYDKDKFREAVDQFQDLKVLVVGDIIFDRYTSVSVQGLTSKTEYFLAVFCPRKLKQAAPWPFSGI